MIFLIDQNHHLYLIGCELFLAISVIEAATLGLVKTGREVEVCPRGDLPIFEAVYSATFQLQL